MKYRLLIIFLLLITVGVHAQDKLLFQGQLSGWANYNPDVLMNAWIGARYIPQLNYNILLPDESRIDFEASANMNASIAFNPFDSAETQSSLKAYRAWTRYSTSQMEIRLGLQKINFGSAAMLRPLMWFDQVDPRDPLGITSGVWGLLGRYYFLNNANLWLWILLGNNETKGLEINKTEKGHPEFGGRLQTPVPKGEIALSYHHRTAEINGSGVKGPGNLYSSENRIAIDGKWDVGPGIWFEGEWINNDRDLGILTNQEVMTLGIDYTFGIGNGINAVFEHMIYATDRTAFAFENQTSFSALSVSYPLGIADRLNGIVYYDWKNKALYNFINWSRDYNDISLHLMAYWNPENYRMLQQPSGGGIFAGRGLQLMLVFNH